MKKVVNICRVSVSYLLFYSGSIRNATGHHKNIERFAKMSGLVQAYCTFVGLSTFSAFIAPAKPPSFIF